MPAYNPYTDTHAIQKFQFLHHFLPHPETQKRARLLSHTALLFYSLVMVLIIAAFHIVPLFAPGVLGYASNITTPALLEGTNELRSQRGLSELTISSALNAAAEKKARHMFDNSYWAHVAPDGTAPWDFILAENYDYTYAGENLAKNFNTSGQVVDAWFDSPSHRDNLLNGNYREIGFAVVNGVLDGYETTLVVQMFGTPRSPQQVAAVPEEPVAPATEPSVQVQPEVVVEPVPAEEPQDVPAFVPAPVVVTSEFGDSQVLPAIDITSASKTITLVVGGFLLSLLALDIWYTRKKAIPKLTGHAFAHVLMLAVTLVGVWFALSPGKIL